MYKRFLVSKTLKICPPHKCNKTNSDITFVVINQPKSDSIVLQKLVKVRVATYINLLGISRLHEKHVQGEGDTPLQRHDSSLFPRSYICTCISVVYPPHSLDSTLVPSLFTSERTAPFCLHSPFSTEVQEWERAKAPRC